MGAGMTMKRFTLALALWGLVAGSALAGQVPNPANVSAPLTTGHGVVATGGQSIGDSGAVPGGTCATHTWDHSLSTAAVPTCTQPASTDLSDTVARTTFVPTVDFTTPGDRTISYATQTGAYTRVGGQTCFWESLTFTPTYTTAAGNLLISFPPSGGPTDANVWAFPIANLSSPTWPSTATLATIEATGGSFIVRGMKSAAGANPFTVSNIPTGVAVTIVFSGCFF